MRYLWVALFVWTSTASLATMPLLPKRLLLVFNINGGQAKVNLNLKRLHNMASMGEQYEEQVREALYNLNLLTQIDNPLLMVYLLEEVNHQEASAFDYQIESPLGGDNSELSYREQETIWQEKYAATYARKELKEIYAKVKLNLENSRKLLKLLSPAKKYVYTEQINKRVEAVKSGWKRRTSLENLFSRYELEKAARVTDFNSMQELKSITDKIMAEIAQLDAVRTEKIKKQIDAMQYVNKHENYYAVQYFSNASYYRATISEMLHDNGVKDQEKEMQLQYLASDLWATTLERLR